jgi:hypothetical protein
MHGFVMTTRLILYCNTLRSDSIASASSDGNDFVPDAVGDVADRDLGPGVVLGGGGGEDLPSFLPSFLPSLLFAPLLLQIRGGRKEGRKEGRNSCYRAIVD